MGCGRRGVYTEVTSTLFLDDGDKIALFTGASDCTHDGPGSLGTLYWTFSCNNHRAQSRLPSSASQKKLAFGGLLNPSSSMTCGHEAPVVDKARSSPHPAPKRKSTSKSPRHNPASKPRGVGALQASWLGVSLNEDQE